ncbi:MAG: hypothetical protein J6A85_09375 [Clostridia bacterium]|nr:hypothetical protein [Clostridia bacterium]
MKRIIGFMLLTVMLFAVLCPIGAQAVTVYDYTLVSKGASYTYSKCYTTAGMPYTSVDGKELTDGKITDEKYATEWIAFDYRLEAPMYAVIDLGKSYDNLGKFRVYLVATAHSGIDKPEKCEFHVSDDGKTFTKVGEGVYESDSAENTWCTLELNGKVSGRYVKVDMGEIPLSGVFVFCGEFEVYTIEGNDVPAASIPGIELKNESYLKSDGDYITKLHFGNTVEYVMKDFDDTTKVTAFSANGTKLGAKNVLKTGDYFAKIVDGTEIDRLYAVFEGDINGDGKITLNDYLHSLRIDKKTSTVSGAFLKANTDKNRIKNHFCGVINMFAAYPHHPVAPDVHVTDYTKHSLTLAKTNDGTYTLSTTASNGKALTQTFYKTNWGTWNIGALNVGGVHLAGGSTDWEYVFRAKGAKDGFSGGNHANEILVDLKIYDGVTGKEIKLSNGQKAQNLEKIKIVEKTKLHLGDSTKCYAAVTRNYTFYGETITLDCDYEFLTDMEFSLSYTCMFPVNKSVGLYCLFRNIDGTENYVETMEVGKADYSGPMYKNNAATECVIWGKKNTDYAFVVKVDTVKDSLDNFRNGSKTFYWDMNTSSNKLYFSRFPDSTYEKVEKGTQWHTSCSWTVFCLDEK